MYKCNLEKINNLLNNKGAQCIMYASVARTVDTALYEYFVGGCLF